MPWNQVTPMEQRWMFVQDYERESFSFAELCRRYGVSRKTGYKWLGRYEAEGEAGLAERSRRPHRSPTRTPEQVREALVELRRRHPSWGAGKLLGKLSEREPTWELPARSTVNALLKREGLLQRRRRRKPGHPGRPYVPVQDPNELWTADFKGEFKTRDGVYCYPLTVADQVSRFLLGCQGLPSVEGSGARPVFEHLFRQYGMPEQMLTDNGTPFGSTALGRLSQLSLWWLHLGIWPITIQPGRPQQNGRHERMHRTLKAATARPPASHARSQQARFDRFRREFNEERPHEALGQRPPATVYRPSSREYPEQVPEFEYPGYFELRKVRPNGTIRWKTATIRVGRLFVGEILGLEEVDDGVWMVFLGPRDLGRLEERTGRIRDMRGRLTRKVSPMS